MHSVIMQNDGVAITHNGETWDETRWPLDGNVTQHGDLARSGASGIFRGIDRMGHSAFELGY